MSRVTAIISALVICIIVCLSWAVNHYRTPLPTSPARQNAQRTEAGKNMTITDMQMRQRDVAALDAKYTKIASMLKLKMMLCVMMLTLVVIRMHIKAVCQSVREATTASGVDNAASPRLANTPLNEINYTLQKADAGKNNWKEPKYINEQCR